MSADEVMNEQLNQSIRLIEQVMEQAYFTSKERDIRYSVGGLGRTIGLIREFQEQIYHQFPDLKTEIKISLDPPLTAEQAEVCSKLSPDELDKIDGFLLSNTRSKFRKVARVIGISMQNELDSFNLPDLFYAERIKSLVKRGKLDSQGNLGAMRFSEVKLPDM
ncbi:MULTISPECIES: DUF3658 domain-containing protein [Pseudoalteromonas]|uniref:DUF3658 domain-containing protein n=1 Tax=Pseudoalteromonas fuliginea TaxID=1872678 RepID=A0ABD3Y4Q1_9GAMM|nr:MULTISPECIES: DUF3658 domain-containing protein [Pseudoalteromonas]KDC49086.1 hypothetical protein DC53_18275 [Pseudoalteromonas fuliginea]KDC49370.1 hypothetical protein DO88_19030 [Pseudoalteromonas sp. S3431]KJZ26939.1 hypothetical protein TW82_14575 [Pseudoalteromonas fuliginea]MDQ2045587.1 DUF3658 domain-containing protein [Pseudoalteromonas sp. 20-92]GAA80478.1 hypothetical protein P20495_2993 [Pseudoalteromonas sp. BSi20495]